MVTKGGSAGKILVVDDSATTLEQARLVLQDSGYEVTIHKGGIGVTNAAVEARPDVILLDVSMPALDGESLVPLLRRKEALQGAVILLHSSKPEYELRSIARGCSADGYICKESDPRGLVKQVKHWLTRGSESAE